MFRFLVVEHLYSEHWEGSTRLLRAQILEEDEADNDTSTDPIAGED
jgi:hypothetical protein